MTEKTIRVIEKLTALDYLAYNFTNAARVIGLSYRSLRREMIRGKIQALATFKLITREELVRYLNEEQQLATRSRRRRIDKSRAA